MSHIETDGAKVAAFMKERDEMLIAGDVDRMLAFYRKYNPDRPPPSSREVAEIMLHKARTAAGTLPLEVRLQSKQWLTKRGYHSLDDGELR